MANITIKPEQLENELGAILQTFNHTVITATDEACVQTAKDTVKQLKQTSPGRGNYAKSWTYKKEKSGAAIVYSKKPGLPHLLEYGHRIVRRGKVYGRVKAYPHIAAAEAQAAADFEKHLKENIEKGI